MFTFWLLMETNLNLHLVFFPVGTSCRRTDLDTQQSGSGLSVDRVSVGGSGLGGDRVWVCRGSGLVCRWFFLVLSPRRFQNVCR